MANWNEIFLGKDWFHVTGITPAISRTAAEVTIEAVKIAKDQGLTVSCDLNYRKKLWKREDAKKTMTEVVKYVDIVIGNEEDASDVFGIESASTDVKSGELSLDHYKTVASKLMDYCRCQKTAITLRESNSASDNNWSALLFNGKELLTSRKYSIHIVDRVGGGDSFCAGLIHGLASGWTDVHSLEFAVAASALKQTIHGDMNIVTEDEVIEILKGDLSGRVQR